MKQKQGKYYNMIELPKIKLNNYYIAIGLVEMNFIYIYIYIYCL